MQTPLFLDDAPVANALDEATDAAMERLAALIPELGTDRGEPFRQRLRAHLSDLLTGHAGPHAAALPRRVHGGDAFGDRFSLADLPLPRPGTGYAVQMLDTDTLLDRDTGRFLAVRDKALKGLFDSFDGAYAAARLWVKTHDCDADHPPLAVVPAYYDHALERHVLIYGVLTQSP